MLHVTFHQRLSKNDYTLISILYFLIKWNCAIHFYLMHLQLIGILYSFIKCNCAIHFHLMHEQFCFTFTCKYLTLKSCSMFYRDKFCARHSTTHITAIVW